MKDVNLTALGVSGSGKTCFLLGMYYEMSAGVNGYTLTTNDDEDDIELRGKWRKINDMQGVARFPTGTDKNGDYQFHLEYAHKRINTFHWMDYKGGIMESKSTENPEEYDELLKRIEESDCLCVFVDGKLLCKEDPEEMIRSVKDNCSSVILRFFSSYQEKKGTLPPIAIVVTKFDACKDYITKEQLTRIIKESFSSLFTAEENTKITIIPVSIGMHIEDEEYAGNLKPLNISKPLFFGIYKPLKNEWEELQKEQKDSHAEMAKLQATYDKITKKIFHKKKKKECKEKIEQLEECLKTIDKKVETFRKYERKIHSELEGLSLFWSGKEIVITAETDIEL